MIRFILNIPENNPPSQDIYQISTYDRNFYCGEYDSISECYYVFQGENIVTGGLVVSCFCVLKASTENKQQHNKWDTITKATFIYLSAAYDTVNDIFIVSDALQHKTTHYVDSSRTCCPTEDYRWS